MYTPGTIANSQRMPTKINKNGPITKVRILVEQVILKRHLKTFRIISNEMLFLLLILCWQYFNCLQMYSEKFFNVYFPEQMLLKVFVAKGDTGCGFNILIQKYFSKEWEQMYQFSPEKQNNKKELSCHKFSLNCIWTKCPINFYFFIFLVYETYIHLLGEFPCRSLSSMKFITFTIKVRASRENRNL